MAKKKLIFKIIASISFVFSLGALSACASQRITNVVFTTDNNAVTVGELDLSKYRIKVDYRDGRSEELVVTESMIDKNDLFKLYEVGTHDITFYYDNFYTTATFIVNKNHFDDEIKFVTNGTYEGEEVFIQEYDALAHSLELTSNIPTNTQIIYPDGNSFRDSKGTPYEVRAILTKDGYEDKVITGKLLIVVSEFSKEHFDQIAFEDLTVPYDGLGKRIEVSDLPPDLSVTYKMYDSTGRQVDTAVDAGEYTVNAIFTLNNNNYTISDENKVKTAKLTITPSSINVTNFGIENAVKTYDGSPIAIKTTGTLPAGVSYEVVIKDSNGKVVPEAKDAGIYTAELVFKTDNNHYVVSDVPSAKLTINKKVIDLKNLTYDLEETTYNGKAKRYTKLDGKLDRSLNAIYTYYKVGEDKSTDPVNVGKYRVDIRFEVVGDNTDNYVFINTPQNSAILIIK